jgi:hypothetical protein
MRAAKKNDVHYTLKENKLKSGDMMFKSREEKEKEHEEIVREVLDEMVEKGHALKDGDKYRLTELGFREGEKLMRQGPNERTMLLIQTAKTYQEKDKKKQEKEKDKQ